MSDIFVKIKKKDESIQTPTYSTVGSAGCDVYSIENIELDAFHNRVLAGTGLFLEIPDGFECQVRPRSGLALKHGVTVLNSPGTIDSDFRGEVKILLYYSSPNEGKIEIRKGERIAQLVFASVCRAKFDVIDELQDTNRGEGGFGSTGK